ncbi:hypothetical protein SSX86_015747 [Deinandra increscens subsp. villosa]|uniref:TF-B3 domain-containing protein n=1 Tax=Deinandra increscens subsp. villosa TaxID=3103831 RepID=A0AAP0GZC5_9ASTR
MDLQMQKQSTETGGCRNNSVMNNNEPQAHGDAEFWPLSGKPYFYAVIDKSKRFQLNIPRELTDELPSTTVPAKIVYREKVWDVLYLGGHVTKTFGIKLWSRFMIENNVTVGDACVFELMEGSAKSQVVKFKVQVLKDDFPRELMEKTEGFCEDNPIDLD